MIPTNIDMILNRKYIENERVEFKKSWNPQPIMHTICAYANDISNLSGGYIIVGINDDGTVEGINPKSMDKMNRDLNDICNKMNRVATYILTLLKRMTERFHNMGPRGT